MSALETLNFEFASSELPCGFGVVACLGVGEGMGAIMRLKMGVARYSVWGVVTAGVRSPAVIVGDVANLAD